MPMTQEERDAQDAIYLANKQKNDALDKIAKLESQVTNRRIRDALLGNDNGWLENQEALIAAQRELL